MSAVLYKRPKLLTIVCIIGYLWIVVTFPAVFSPAIKKLGDWNPAIYGAIVACSFISFIGVWHMKKWGANLYIATFFAKQIFLFLIGDDGASTYAGIFFSVLFITTFLIYYKRMDENL